MSDVVVSFGRDDRAKAARVVQLLQRAGYACWWRGQLPDGPVRENLVHAKVSESKLLLVLWSESATDSGWVEKECRWAAGRVKVALLGSAVTAAPPAKDQDVVEVIGWDGRDARHDGVAELLEAVNGWLGGEPLAADEEDEVGAGGLGCVLVLLGLFGITAIGMTILNRAPVHPQPVAPPQPGIRFQVPQDPAIPSEGWQVDRSGARGTARFYGTVNQVQVEIYWERDGYPQTFDGGRFDPTNRTMVLRGSGGQLTITLSNDGTRWTGVLDDSRISIVR